LEPEAEGLIGTLEEEKCEILLDDGRNVKKIEEQSVCCIAACKCNESMKV
jgi:hypothetical protein